VVRTDPSFPSVELDHDEIKGIMPAMRMEFYVKDKAMLNGLKAGDKVDFVLEDKAGAEMIVEMKKK
jgi:Cu/Ag efflux protein CusF